jgi:MFS family permease
MYDWLIFLHVLSALTFMLAHGASAAVMFRVRAEREPSRIHALLDLSQTVGSLMGLTGLALFLTGLIGGFMGQWWNRGWIWASLALLIGLSIVMGSLGRTYFDRVRHALGLATVDDQKKKVAPPPALPAAELSAVLNAGQPRLLAAVGVGGLALLTWLMMFKPF